MQHLVLETTAAVIDKKLDAKVREKLITARVSLLLQESFFGNLATRLKLINADDWLETAATDGRNFYYNTSFINQLTPKEVEFLFGHEVLHAIYSHILRREEREADIWNIACDYCVNADLVKHKIGTMIPTALYSKKYDDMCAEQVYDHLAKNAKKINIPKLLEGMLDKHLKIDKANGEDGEDGEGGPALSAEELQQIGDELKIAVIQAVQTTSEENIPGNVKRLIKQITQPQLNWRELLSQRIQSLVKDDYTWMRASRRGWHMDAVMPGMKTKETIDVCISLDSSGSISREMLQDFLGEVRGMMQEFDDFRISIWCIDTKVYNFQVFTSDNIDEFDDYEIMGHGGNTFEENWRFMRKMDIVPKLFIMFTDGYPCGSWGDEDYCDSLFVIHGNQSIVAPFGQTAYYEK